MADSTQRRIAGLLVTAGLVLAASIRSSPGVEADPAGGVPHQPAPLAAPSFDAAPAVTPQSVGVAGCAAANCHGGNRYREGVHFSAYQIWIQQDPHARAYEVLLNDQSKQIARLQRLPAAHEAAACLSCHTAFENADHLPASRRYLLTDGVSCEACHGPAEKWIEPHRSLDWKNPAIWPEARKLATGFRNTKDLASRARVCAECHVGSPGRDVNHDLIAAGHPRLDFELGAFHANLPAHWDRKKDKARYSSSLEARVWAVGQVASAAASVRLLQARSAAQHAPWPEFAEYGCFACHHDLHSPSWRQDQPRPSRGALDWGTWNFSFLPTAVGLLAPEQTDPLTTRVTDLRGLMQQRSPDRELVRHAANDLAHALEQLSQSVAADPLPQDKLQKILAGLSTPSAPDLPRQWDTAAQLYLALVAVRQGYLEISGRSPRDGVAPHLEKLRDGLKFPQHQSSPRFLQPEQVDEFKSEIDRIHQLLEHQ